MNAVRDVLGVGTVVKRWTLVAAVFVIYSSALVVGGCQFGAYREVKAHDDAALRDLKAENTANQKELAARGALDSDLTAQAATRNAQASNEFTQLRLEVPRVIATIVPSKEPAHYPLPSASAEARVEAAPGCAAVSADFVRVWNGALTVGRPNAANLDASAAGPGDHDPFDKRSR